MAEKNGNGWYLLAKKVGVVIGTLATIGLAGNWLIGTKFVEKDVHDTKYWAVKGQVVLLDKEVAIMNNNFKYLKERLDKMEGKIDRQPGIIAQEFKRVLEENGE